MPRSKSTLPLPMFGSYSTRVVRPRGERRRILPRRLPAMLAEIGRCGLIETDVGPLSVHAVTSAHPVVSESSRGSFPGRRRLRKSESRPLSTACPYACFSTWAASSSIPRNGRFGSSVSGIGLGRTSVRGHILLKCRVPGVDVFTGEAQMATDLVRHRAVPFNPPPVDRLLG